MHIHVSPISLSFRSALRLIIDVGKILAGIQVPPGAEDAFDAFLQELGYPFVEETLNPAYKNFLCS